MQTFLLGLHLFCVSHADSHAVSSARVETVLPDTSWSAACVCLYHLMWVGIQRSEEEKEEETPVYS